MKRKKLEPRVKLKIKCYFSSHLIGKAIVGINWKAHITIPALTDKITLELLED